MNLNTLIAIRECLIDNAFRKKQAYREAKRAHDEARDAWERDEGSLGEVKDLRAIKDNAYEDFCKADSILHEFENVDWGMMR